MKNKTNYLIACGELARQVVSYGHCKADYSGTVNRICLEYDIAPMTIKKFINNTINELRGLK